MGASTIGQRARTAGQGCPKRRGHESGVIAIMMAGMLFLMFAFCSLAIELSQAYNRKVEMQNVADTLAVAAAYELDGTPDGISRAVQKAAARFSAPAPSQLTYQYGKRSMSWSDSAIQYGATPRGPWTPHDIAAAKPAPNGLLYVKIDTSRLDLAYGKVTTLFMRVVSNSLSSVSVSASAVAGRVGIGVTPLGVCAMRSEANRNRNGELEQYGFRRGVSYDLMQSNPQSTTVGQTFLIDPLVAPGANAASVSSLSTVAPFVCTGTLGIARVTGGAVSVSSPFPLGTLFDHLNSRFDKYAATTAPCSPDSAPPDTNVKPYTYNSIGWMTTVPAGQSAALSTVDGKRWTVAGPDPTPAGTTAGQYGVLWSYAKAVNYAASPPSTGYTAYDATSWKTLYDPGQPKANSYPSTPPYFKAAYTKEPSHAGITDRRVLNVALLSCPVSGNTAIVSAIGRFFMTVPADGTHLYAEFAGLADEQTLRTQVKLFP